MTTAAMAAYAPEQCLYQNTRSRSAPRQQLSLAEQAVGGCAHQLDRLVAIPTPSPFAGHVHVDERSIPEVMCMACEHVADLGQERLSAVTLRSRLAVYQRDVQRHSGEGVVTQQHSSEIPWRSSRFRGYIRC
jgi:hypothetical protein